MNRGYDALKVMRKGGKKGSLAIHPQAAQRIRDYLDLAKHGDDLDGPLFRPVKDNRKVQDSRRHLAPIAVDRVLRKYASSIGLNRGYSAHSMRATFIGRMVQHTVSKGFKRIRYYGVQATKTFAKVKVMIQTALAKVEGVVQGAVKIITRLTYRQRYAQSTGRDPFRCPHCQSTMDVWYIWHPTYGVIYDEGEVIKRGTYAAIAPRAGP